MKKEVREPKTILKYVLENTRNKKGKLVNRLTITDRLGIHVNNISNSLSDAKHTLDWWLMLFELGVTELSQAEYRSIERELIVYFKMQNRIKVKVNLKTFKTKKIFS